MRISRLRVRWKDDSDVPIGSDEEGQRAGRSRETRVPFDGRRRGSLPRLGIPRVTAAMHLSVLAFAAFMAASAGGQGTAQTAPPPSPASPTPTPTPTPTTPSSAPPATATPSGVSPSVLPTSVLPPSALPPSGAPRGDTGAAAARPATSTGEAWRINDMPQSTLVYARDGSLIGEIGHELRTSVPLSSLPTYVPEAFIAIEDRRFYQHNGVDVIGMIGALKDRVIGRRMRGASTITQQLVGNMHPDVINRRDMSIDRKLREQDAAREMERHYTKAQVLEAYLNFIPFGHGWFGIDAAARHYFGKPAGRLSLAEAATLAALPRSAPYYDPIRHPERARQRRDLVLREMASQDLITPAAAAAAKREPLGVVPRALEYPAPYFVDAVRAAALQAGIPVDAGGYRLYTTLDPVVQRAGVVALAEGTAGVEDRPGYKHPTLAQHAHGTADYLQGLLIAIEPATGEVRALVGGRDYQDSPFDRALGALRQPGSAFKPIVYATAIADSIPANEIMDDTALAIPLPDGTVYRPDDAEGQFAGPMTLRDALVQSRNSVAIQLAMHIGLDSIIDVAHRFGLTTPIAPYPSSAIGASGVRPIDLVSAYDVFATLGTVAQPQMLLRVEDRVGRTVWTSHGPALTTVLDSSVAFIVRDMLRDVLTRGTAAGVRQFLPPWLPVAGKTGTTNDNTDVWFVGCTPHLVAGVWLGFDTPQTITPGAAGGSLAAPIWAHFMASVSADSDSTSWAPPPGVVSADLDRLSGAPADSTTPPDRRYTEYFLPGTEPGQLRTDAISLFARGAVVY